MSELIPAATILLLRDRPAFEVMMVERHAGIAFAGGALVFPGGRIDEGDCIEAWASCCDGFAAVPQEQRAPRIASIREAFEETGILVARRNGVHVGCDEAMSLAPWRARIEADDRLFLEMVREEGLTLDLCALHLFARWRPSESAGHRRYDTWFFAAHSPPDQVATADGGEATEVLWTAPAAALAARDANQRKMIFPTSRNVELLNVSNCAENVFAWAQTRPQCIIEPQVIERDGCDYLSIPAGMGYPVTEEPLDQVMRGWGAG